MLTAAHSVGVARISSRAHARGKAVRRVDARAFAASRSRSRNAATTVAAWVLKNSGPNTTEHLGEELTTPSDLPLTAARMVVGRQASDSVSLEIAVPTVSGAHAMIEVTDAKVTVTDLSSTNGTFIDGEELLPGVPTQLVVGGEVIFGDEFLARFELVEAGGEDDDAQADAE